MSINLFNYTNQKLNADKLREIEAFTSGNFAGVIGNSFPISFIESGNSKKAVITASQSSPVTFLGGGLLLQVDNTIQCSLNMNDTLGYLEVSLDSSVANITTDELIRYIDISTQENLIQFKSCSCSVLENNRVYTYFSPIFESSGSPHDNDYYEYVYDDTTSTGSYVLSADTEVDSSKTYYYKMDTKALTFCSNALGTYSIFTYFGNTIWLDDTTFIIPLCANIDGELWSSVVYLKDINDFESLLTLESYARLKNYCDGTFVWSSGGEDTVIAPDGSTHKKGDVGSLNITGDTIYNNTNANSPVKINKLAINNLTTAFENDPTKNTKLSITSDGEVVVVKNYIQHIPLGGTGANNRSDAKINLGIGYGKNDPNQIAPFVPVMEGDIYLRIIE